jgi:acyl carrier protein
MEAMTPQELNLNALGSLEREIVTLISEITEIEEQDVWAAREAHFFEDMEIDSLLALEILASIEKKYGVEVPEERLPEITTLMNTIVLVRSLLS